MGDLVLADFKSRTWHKTITLEQQAQELAKEFTRMSEEGTEVIAVPYGGEGIDGMNPNDCA